MPALVLSWHERLAQLYAEPHRHYHNAEHINDCLLEFDRVRTQANKPLNIELALWFHDAIYDPRAPDNEEQSADLARRCLNELGAEAQVCESVTRLILATKRHDGLFHPDAPLMVDLDLSILGQPAARFQAYEASIRKEYDWVPAHIFTHKRAEILDNFLARERIYHTEYFFRRYETTARANLRESIKHLRHS